MARCLVCPAEKPVHVMDYFHFRFGKWECKHSIVYLGMID